MQVYRKASLRAGGASHSSRTFGESLEAMISPSRLDDDSCYDISSTFLPEIYRQSLVRRPVFSLVRLLVRPWPYRESPAAGEPAPTYAPSHTRYAISCHVMYTHTPMVLQQMSKHSQSTNQRHVFAFQVGRSVRQIKDYCLNTSSSSKMFRQGGHAWNLVDFNN